MALNKNCSMQATKRQRWSRRYSSIVCSNNLALTHLITFLCRESLAILRCKAPQKTLKYQRSWPESMKDQLWENGSRRKQCNTSQHTSRNAQDKRLSHFSIGLRRTKMVRLTSMNLLRCSGNWTSASTIKSCVFCLQYLTTTTTKRFQKTSSQLCCRNTWRKNR